MTPLEIRHDQLRSRSPHFQAASLNFATAPFVPQHICSNGSEEGGEKIAIRWILEGHHLGYSSGALGAPTGHKLVVMGITHLHLREGKIVEEWVLYDELSMLVQLKLAALQQVA